MQLFDSLARWARLRGHAPALVDATGSLDYAGLEQAVQAAAAALGALGFRPGDRVGIALRDSSALLVASLATMAAGLVAAPLDWRARADERATLARGFGLKATLVSGPARATGELGWPLPPAPAGPAAPPPGDRDPVLLLLSSGTTGLPSGALIPAAALDARLVAGAAQLGDLAGHRYLSCIPLCFSMGITTALRMLAHGACVQVHPPLYTPAELLASATRLGITAMCLVPTALRSLLQAASGPRPLPGLDLLMVGGAVLPAELRDAAQARLGPRCFATYGAAASGPVCYTSFQDLADHPGTVGRPHDWLELRLVDHRGQAVNRGEAGHLEVRGPTVAHALLTLDGGLVELADGWYRPGDVARLDDQGYLRIEGRGTDVINRAGVNVYPELVEQALLGHPAVTDAAVVSHARADGDEEVVALLVLQDPALLAEVEALCRTRLSPKYLPDRWVTMAQLPKTASGKVRRGAARDLWLGGAGLNP